MSKILGLIAYVLVAAMALKFLGSWTLYLSLGVPLLVVAGYAIYFAYHAILIKSGEASYKRNLRGEVLEIIELLDNADGEKKLLDILYNNVLIQKILVPSFKSNNGYIPPALQELSNKYLGKFIGYMLLEREYPDKLYISILRNLRKLRDRNIDEVIEGVGMANSAAMGKFKFLINKEQNR